MIQVLSQVTTTTIEQKYTFSGGTPSHYKMVFCWLNPSLTWFLFVIAFALICGNIYFCLFKGYFFIKITKQEIRDNNDETRLNVKKQIQNINQIQATLFLYPSAACLLWGIFFGFRLYFEINGFESQSNTTTSWVYSLFVSTRQIIYTLVYFLTQQKLKDYAILVLMCKTCKKKKRRANLAKLTKEANQGKPLFSINDKRESVQSNE